MLPTTTFALSINTGATSSYTLTVSASELDAMIPQASGEQSPSSFFGKSIGDLPVTTHPFQKTSKFLKSFLHHSDLQADTLVHDRGAGSFSAVGVVQRLGTGDHHRVQC